MPSSHASADARAETAAVRLRVLTLNLHKGFSALNRRFVLHEIRAAVRLVGADIVFLQEVLGAAPAGRADSVSLPQYEFLADSIWSHESEGLIRIRAKLLDERDVLGDVLDVTREHLIE